MQMTVKRILIIVMVLLPLLESCDKGDPEKLEPESIDFVEAPIR